MGYAAKANPLSRQGTDQRTKPETVLRRLLCLFPDRATYEAWLTARDFPEDMRDTYERLLPERLKAQGTV